MARHVALLGEHLNIEQINRRRRVVEAAVEAYCAEDGPGAAQFFLGYTQSEVLAEKETLLDELRRSASMDVFGALEAAFQVDFFRRCYGHEKDDISLAFKEIYHDRGTRVPLGTILAVWRKSDVASQRAIEVSSALKYRHWLAHGRYWIPGFPKKLPYDEVYKLAKETLATFPLKDAD